MTALLTRLRIAGFKSFAEPASLDILPGLTGIVGPNGCGKSNVVEALRWAMGESSARSLRGGEMDDVIFAGTAARASRNLAEVTITLERGPDALPDPFGAEEELQVTRRIERGAGSAYRANGRELRARDVQTLFADLASGAKSSAMVSQGRVAALVNARPEERRAVLEEAAGITGLHARRHEAELKLRAAEANLVRAEELRTQFETTREGLRKQARQAARYRNISGLVRAAEADFLAVLHARAALAASQAEEAQGRAQADAAAAEQAARDAAAALDEAEAALLAPQAAEAEARGRLERARLHGESIGQDIARAEHALLDAQSRLAVIGADLADARSLDADAAAMLATLGGEADALAAKLDTLPARIAASASEAASCAEAASQAESAAHSAAIRASDAAASARQAEAALAQAEDRLAAARAGCDGARHARDEAGASQIDQATLKAAEHDAGAAETTLLTARRGSVLAVAARDEAAAAAAAARAHAAQEAQRVALAQERAQEAEARLARLDQALASVSRDLAEAQAARVPASALAEAQDAMERAREAEGAAEAAVWDAETAHAKTSAARLAALAGRDRARADRARLEDARADGQARLGRLTEAWSAVVQSLAELRAAAPDSSAVEQVAVARRDAEDAAREAEAAWRLEEAARQQAGRILDTARERALTAAADLARLSAEQDGIGRALGDDPADGAMLLDALDVPAGLEAACGALFADAPSMLEQDGAARFWRVLPPLPGRMPLDHCLPLDAMVRAPAALHRALAHAALLPDGADGDALAASLPPGWVLLSKAGDAWRWDGQVTRAGAPSAASSRLHLRARLRDLSFALDAARADDEAARAAFATATASSAAAAEAEAASRARTASASASLAGQERALAALRSQEEGVALRLAALLPAERRGEDDVRLAEALLADIEASLAAMPPRDVPEAAWQSACADEDGARRLLDQAREARNAARLVWEEAQSAWRAREAAAAAAENHVAALQPQYDRVATEHTEADAAYRPARAALDGLPDVDHLRDRAAREHAAFQAAETGLARANQAAEHALQAQVEAASAAAALQRRQEQAVMALCSAETVLEAAEAALAREAAAHDAARAWRDGIPDPSKLAAAAAESRAALSAVRARWASVSEVHASQAASLADARGRRDGVAADTRSWTARHEEAARRLAALTARAQAAAAECSGLAEAPAHLAARAAELAATVAASEALHDAASRALRKAEDGLREAARARREAEAAQSACREILARGEGGAEAAQAALRTVLARAAERLGQGVDLPDPPMPEGGEAAEERARRKLDRLQRERDEMGPVNLRADIELDEIDIVIAGIETEREELATAIAKLRGGIGHLNREGRERLAAVFAQVDGHFRALFTRMMGGGRAHLALVGSDDPLEAGLEIYAEPPGKKLSALTLLSGGEQALTALSLIFAVFRCTPAPVAVLDEVDAPLDDVNVDRFCGLLEDVVRDTGTRFLVVTHHQLTMSRMDRLFGVTMQERGVSRLLSVDLRRAAEMVEPVMVAAA